MALSHAQAAHDAAMAAMQTHRLAAIKAAPNSLQLSAGDAGAATLGDSAINAAGDTSAAAEDVSASAAADEFLPDGIAETAGNGTLTPAADAAAESATDSEIKVQTEEEAQAGQSMDDQHDNQTQCLDSAKAGMPDGRSHATETDHTAMLQQQLDRIRQSAVMLPEPAEVLVSDLVDHRYVCCAALRCAALCCAVLRCAVLCCTALQQTCACVCLSPRSTLILPAG